MSKILAVDDSNAILCLISDIFSSEHEVIKASNGKEGVEKAFSEMPDIVLMDVNMPVMDGIAATRTIKEDPRTRGLPVILLTGLGGEESTVMGLDAGADDYIGKPFNVKILKARIRSHLRSKALYDSLEQAYKDMDIILDITKKTTSTLNISQVLHTITEKISKYLNLYRCSVVLVDDDTRHGLIVASSDDPEIGGLCIYLDKYPEIMKVLETRETVVVDDVNSDPVMAGVRIEMNLPFRSLMVVPIIFKDKIIGTFFLRATKRSGGFSMREVDFCRMIANASSSAIKNSALFEKLEDANKRLLDLDRLKSNFIAMAAHELRTPLNVVNGYLEMLGEGVVGKPNPRQLEFINRALESNNDLMRLVKEMLDIGVIESGQVVLEQEECDAAEVVYKALDLFKKDAEKKGVRINYPDNHASALFDRKRVHQVLINLISNAIKFTPQGGEISVAIRDGMHDVRVSVSDTGTGIPDQDVERVFDEFYRSDSSEEGTGLGLSICKRIIVLHGGSIWAESKLGSGSSFHFTLPKKKIDSRG